MSKTHKCSIVFAFLHKPFNFLVPRTNLLHILNTGAVSDDTLGSGGFESKLNVFGSELCSPRTHYQPYRSGEFRIYRKSG